MEVENDENGNSNLVFVKSIDKKQNQHYIITISGRADKETKVKEVLLYLADKLVDFLLTLVVAVVTYYITKWLDKKSK